MIIAAPLYSALFLKYVCMSCSCTLCVHDVTCTTFFPKMLSLVQNLLCHKKALSYI